MKTFYAHCILKFTADDEFPNDALEQGVLKVLDEAGLDVLMCNIEVDDEE